jgi:hypothetical protein
MRAALHNLPTIQHENLVGCENRAKAVRDDDARAPMLDFRQRFLNKRLALTIKATGGFV